MIKSKKLHICFNKNAHGRLQILVTFVHKLGQVSCCPIIGEFLFGLFSARNLLPRRAVKEFPFVPRSVVHSFGWKRYSYNPELGKQVVHRLPQNIVLEANKQLISNPNNICLKQDSTQQ